MSNALDRSIKRAAQCFFISCLFLCVRVGGKGVSGGFRGGVTGDWCQSSHCSVTMTWLVLKRTLTSTLTPYNSRCHGDPT